MNNYIENKQDFREEQVILAENPVLFIPMRTKPRYQIHIAWEGLAGGGSLALHGSNYDSGTDFFPILDPDDESEVVLPISGASGSDYIRNYSGHLDKCLVLEFKGFSSGTATVKINFSL